jgi:hypothetical protein
MRARASIALLVLLACLLGCTLPTTPPASTTTPLSGNWTNWQIQAGTAITSPPNTYPSFLGAIQVQGTQAAGIFTTVVAAGTTGQPLDYTGAFDSSTQDVTLATFGYGFDYTQPTTPYTLVPVSVIGGCVYPPGYTGAEFLAIFAVPSVGVEIAPLNGTYTGTLTGTLTTTSPATSMPITGTANLMLTQSATPNSSGQFPLTATVTFPSASGLDTVQYQLGGTISGIGITLQYSSAAVIGPGIGLVGYTNPTATQITVSNLYYAGGGVDTFVTLTGTLTLQ